MDKVKPSAPSTVGKGWNTAISRVMKWMAPACSIYSVKFRNLWEGHALGAKENLSGKMDHVLVDSSYNVHRDQNGDHTEYECSDQTI